MLDEALVREIWSSWPGWQWGPTLGLTVDHVLVTAVDQVPMRGSRFHPPHIGLDQIMVCAQYLLALATPLVQVSYFAVATIHNPNIPLIHFKKVTPL